MVGDPKICCRVSVKWRGREDEASLLQGSDLTWLEGRRGDDSAECTGRRISLKIKS